MEVKKNVNVEIKKKKTPKNKGIKMKGNTSQN